MGQGTWFEVKRNRRVLFYLTVSIGLVVGIYFTLLDDYRLRQPDVRQIALASALEIIPRGSKVAIDLGIYPPPEGAWQLYNPIWLGNHSLDWYRENGFEYLMLSERLVISENRTVIQDLHHQQIQTDATLLTTYIGSFLNSADQRIWLYSLEQ